MSRIAKIVDGRYFRLLIPIELLLIALFNTADMLTTVMGLNMGGSEAWPGSIQIMQAVGVPGFVVVKLIATMLAVFFGIMGIEKVRTGNRFVYISFLCLLSALLIHLFMVVESNVSLIALR